MDEVKFIPLKKISSEKGSVFHVIKNPDFFIREVYVSTVKKNSVKGWKKHKEMTLNLTVIKGRVKFNLTKNSNKCEYIIGDHNYGRLVVQPGWWVSFEGIDEENIILNCADLEHNSEEIEVKAL